jgi:hypothetical protein
MNSPVPGNGKGMLLPQATSSLTSPTSAISQDFKEDPLSMRPSHDYGRFKQQTGLPIQADHIRALGQQQIFPGYNSGIYDAQFWDGMESQNSMGGLDALLEVNEDFIDPNAIMKQEEAQANFRVYPGMHQQAAQQRQAMMAKQKQREAEQQRQQEQQRASVPRRSTSSQPLDQRTEDTISRVMSEIRRSSNIAADSLSPPGSVLPHVIKAKRDEDDMDEDERLLNSEEGKKLSSKERRQLRNKVSARAFRSRRKEYITQLEAEITTKTNEGAELKRQNQMLMEENARFRALAEKLLSHNAFRPFLEELSRDPDLAESFSQVTSSNVVHTQPQIAKDADPFQSSQQFIPQNSTTHVGMTFVPEMPVDLSSLNIGTNSWGVPQQAIQHNMYQQPSVFAVTELPQGPAEPIDLSALSGKDNDSLLAEFECSEEKSTYPEIEAVPAKAEPVIASKASESLKEPTNTLDENDPTVTLFATRSAPAPVEETEFEPIFGHIAPEKAFAHFELFVSSEQDNTALMTRFESMTAKLDVSCRRLEAMISRF